MPSSFFLTRTEGLRRLPRPRARRRGVDAAARIPPLRPEKCRRPPPRIVHHPAACHLYLPVIIRTSHRDDLPADPRRCDRVRGWTIISRCHHDHIPGIPRRIDTAHQRRILTHSLRCKGTNRYIDNPDPVLAAILAHPAKPCQHIRYIPISPLIQHFQADQLRPRRHTLIASRRRRAAAGNHPCHMRSMPIVIIRLLFFLKEIPKSVNAIFQIRMQKYPCVQDRHPDAFSCQSSSVRLIAMNPFSRPVHRKKPPYSSLTVRIWGLSPYVNAASYLWKL